MKKISILLLSFFLVLAAYAAEGLTLKSAPELKEATSTSMEIHWEKVDGALAYVVHYGKKPKSQDGYEMNTAEEFNEQTGATLENLEPGTKYYVAVTVLDQAALEWDFSPEAILETKSAGQTKLSLKDIAVVSSKELKLSFNNSLKASVPADIKLVDASGKNQEIVSSEIKGTTVTLTMKSDLNPNTKYDATVISIEDINGKSIESWVDAVISVTTPAQFSTETVPEVTSETDEDGTVPPDEVVELNSGMVEETTTPSGTVNQSIAGENINVAVTSQTTTKLPQTGPEHIILVILSLLVWAGVFMYSRKQQIN